MLEVASATGVSAARARRINLIANALASSGAGCVGLLPASSGTRTESLTIEIGLALAESCRENVAIVLADPAAVGAPFLWAEDSMVGRWATRSAAVLSPARLPRCGETSALLSPVCEYARRCCRHSLLDVSALPGREEQLLALRLMEGACSVVVAGKTKESELLSLEEAMSTVKFLGVLLVGQ